MWAQNSLWACMDILVSGQMRIGPENLYLNIYLLYNILFSFPK